MENADLGVDLTTATPVTIKRDGLYRFIAKTGNLTIGVKQTATQGSVDIATITAPGYLDLRFNSGQSITPTFASGSATIMFLREPNH
jgi:hypothetical protein